MPTLEMINERFARYTRISLFNLLRRSAEVSAGGIQIQKFGEYMHTLYVPTSINMIRLRPLRGTALFVLDAKLVFKLVEIGRASCRASGESAAGAAAMQDTGYAH